MRSKYFLAFAFLCLCPCYSGGLFAQKNIEVVGQEIPASSRSFFLGEVHGIRDGLDFKFALIRWLHSRYGIVDVVLEHGKSEAYLFNEYLQRGDTAILAWYGSTDRTRAIMKQYKDLYEETGFILHGIDFERAEFVPVVLQLLARHEEAMQTKLYKYLSGIAETASKVKDDVSGKKQRVKIYRKAGELFTAEKQQLQLLLQHDFATVLEIMENPATELHFRKRDEGMFANLQSLHTSNGRGFLCVAGMAHTSMHHASAMKLYTEVDSNRARTALVSMVCKNCYTVSHFASMTVPMTSDYEEKNEEYMTMVFDRYYKPGQYSLIEQHEFKDLPGGYNAVPTWYVLFKDQPKW